MALREGAGGFYANHLGRARRGQETISISAVRSDAEPQPLTADANECTAAYNKAGCAFSFKLFQGNAQLTTAV